MRQPSKKGEVSADRLPGHWLLASLGKKVLRPGGVELTHGMIHQLNLGPEDEVIEFAPGLGATARLLLSRGPRSYIGVDRDDAVIQSLKTTMQRPGVAFLTGSAETTGLPPESASIVLGEAMLSMQTPEQKRRIVAEAYRVLKPGGRYAIHELALLPDQIAPDIRKEIEREMSLSIHVGVRPATLGEWQETLAASGFDVIWQKLAPMHLLEPQRVVADEGLRGALRIATNIARKPEARRRVLAMRSTFQRYSGHLSAIALISRKR